MSATQQLKEGDRVQHVRLSPGTAGTVSEIGKAERKGKVAVSWDGMRTAWVASENLVTVEAAEAALQAKQAAKLEAEASKQAEGEEKVAAIAVIAPDGEIEAGKAAAPKASDGDDIETEVENTPKDEAAPKAEPKKTTRRRRR